MAIGPQPRYLEELSIGGGYGDPENGGADFEKNGDLVTNGDVMLDGDLSVGKDEDADHRVSVTAGAARDASLHLNAEDGDNGGTLWYDGEEAKLCVGTRDGAATPAAAVEIAQGAQGITVLDDSAVLGNLDVYDADSTGAELVTNGGMEGTYSGGVAPSWETTGSDITPSEETTDVYAGASSQKLTIALAASNNGLQSASGTQFTISEGVWYLLTFALKVNSGSLEQVCVFGTGYWQYLFNDTTNGLTDNAWTLKSFAFQAMGGATNCKLVFRNAFNAPAEILLDEVSLKPITGGDLGVANDLAIGGDFQCAGDGNFTGALTAASYADNSPVYVGEDALAQLARVRPMHDSVDGSFAEVEHDTLGEMLVVKRHTRYREKATGAVLSARSVVDAFRRTAGPQETLAGWLGKHCEIVEATTQHRDLGKQVQINSAAVLELLARVRELEGATGV